MVNLIIGLLSMAVLLVFLIFGADWWDAYEYEKLEAAYKNGEISDSSSTKTSQDSPPVESVFLDEVHEKDISF